MAGGPRHRNKTEEASITRGEKMIPWYYAVATFFLGGFAGILAMAVCAASGMASRAEEERRSE